MGTSGPRNESEQLAMLDCLLGYYYTSSAGVPKRYFLTHKYKNIIVGLRTHPNMNVVEFVFCVLCNNATTVTTTPKPEL